MAFDQKKILDNFSKYLKDENFLKKLFIGLGIAAILVLASIFLLKTINQEDYGVLYTKLNAEDAGDILEVLQKNKIPYKIKGNGTIILVPKDKIYEVRLKLASQGIPSSKSVGFEIFNEPKMGATHFQENINYLRAIEGELERTIQKIDAIESTKVNIAMPQESIFVRENEDAKASVIIKLGPGRDLTKEQVKAIVFLVSHSVPKLKPENVTVVDNRGRVLSDILSQNSDSDIDSVSVKQKIERDIERKIESMLAKALGPQKVVVRVTAQIENAKIRQKDELYDPDKTAVVSQRQIKNSEKGYNKNQSGAPGTPTNVPAVINTNQNNLLTEKNKKDTTTNYDVSKSIIDTQKDLFKIKRLSIGVLIDGKYKIIKDKNGTTSKIFIPRSKEELSSYEELIKSAAGFDPKRGDKISVISVPFESQALMNTESKNKKNRQTMIILIAISIVALILFILLIVFFIKAKKAKEAKKLAEEAKLKESFEKMEKMREEEQTTIDFTKDPIYQKIVQMVDENPEIVASLVSKWIKEESK